tara:strand:+ start:554 stop:1093 length:540 start_codon:yes stop_codon:yes gene_type:complete
MTSQLRVDKIVPVDGVPSGGGGGVIQVVSTEKTDVDFSTSANLDTKATITGLNATITPKFSTSKVLVIMHLLVGASGDTTGGGTILRDSTPIGIADASSNRTRNTFGFGVKTTGSLWITESVSRIILDSPNTTSATTYSVKIGGNGGVSIYINREGRNNDNATDTTIGSSSLTLMEISA